MVHITHEWMGRCYQTLNSAEGSFSEWGRGDKENVRTSPRKEEDGTGAWHGVSLSRTSVFHV